MVAGICCFIGKYIIMAAKEDIIAWMKEGSDIRKGVALYRMYGDNSHFKKMLAIDPVPLSGKLKLCLAKIAGIKSTNYSATVRQLEKDKFRRMYPFLADPGCPIELKALAADKITTYWSVVELHERLFSCHKNVDCLNTVRELVNTFVEDQAIKRELDYYKQYGGVLGEHRIFDETKRISRIRNMNLKELFRKEKQLKDNIWRIKSELAKGDKLYLQHEREVRLQEKEKELIIVQKMLED